ncbi:MAG: FGGY family carbohydrate kinase, partial [Bacteroidota bacterium]
MPKASVIAIFDVGKTNKKLLLFDEQYKLVYEESKQFEEINDEDGFAGEDINALTNWLKDSFLRLSDDNRFDIKALNFSGYGASFVYLDDSNKVFLPLYNYLKPYSPQLQKQFYDNYGGENNFARLTASPVLGNLNSGMQLYRLKYEKPESFKNIRYALHLPQYLSYIFSGKPVSDITSIGCHTNLWNFEDKQYHAWVAKEGVQSKLAPVENSEEIAGYVNENIPAGIGLHDSSAALIPYLAAVQEPFILLSTGTWCISLNPFNQSPLTDDELQHDCLCYLTYQGNAVKASRLFAGNEHEQQTKRLSAYFKKPNDYFTTVQCDIALFNKLKEKDELKT